MERTYQILLTLNVPDTGDDSAIKECIYSYLEKLINDDSLEFIEVQHDLEL